MELTIRHHTVYSYDPAVDRAGLRLKLFPRTTTAQTVAEWAVEVNGETIEPQLTNAFGEAEASWFTQSRTDRIEILAMGRVALIDTSGVLGKMGHARPSVFLRETSLTEPDEAIRALAAEITGATALDRMHALTSRIHEAITYRKDTTDAGTTAAQVLKQGTGVCQDLAHLFMAAARVMGVPARYITGYYRDEAEDLATHAWAEAHLDGLGWTGFDPTHEMCPADGHIRLCSGFDAADAAPIRGHTIGETEEDLDVSVQIDTAQSQTQQ